jgi:Domain of unknown function (DUF6532)
LATQPQAEIVRIIDQLLDNDAFLNGSINVSHTPYCSKLNAYGFTDQVGGQMIVVPFGHSALRYFIKHILFYNLNFQQYVNDTNRNIGPLLAFVGTLFRWALQELSTGTFLQSAFDLSPARIAVDEGLYNVYTALSSEVRDALIADIYSGQ